MSSGQLLGQWIDVHAQTFVARPNSDGGVGVVTHEHDDGSFDIRYSVSNTGVNMMLNTIHFYSTSVRGKISQGGG